MSDDRFAAILGWAAALVLVVVVAVLAGQRDVWRERAILSASEADQLHSSLCSIRNAKLRTASDTLRIMRRDPICARYLP